MVKKNNKSSFGAEVTGAVMGAMAGAAAVVLSNPKNRKKIENKFNEYKKDGQKIISDIQGKVEDMTSEGEEKIVKVKKAVKK